MRCCMARMHGSHSWRVQPQVCDSGVVTVGVSPTAGCGASKATYEGAGDPAELKIATSWGVGGRTQFLKINKEPCT